MTRKTKTKPPKHLSLSSRKWFESVIANYELDAHHIRLLQAAAESWDDAQNARAIVKKDGMTVVDRYDQVKPHPMIDVARQSRVVFARLVRELGLDVALPESRPPRHGGQQW